MKYNSTTNQNIKRRFVDREVIYCVSMLVHELANKAEEFPEYAEELYSAYRGLPDYEEALTDNGFEEFEDEYGATCWRDTSDGTTWAGSAEDVCNDLNIDTRDYAPDIYEHWIVSKYLARKLEQHGHRVLNDFFGMVIWCRPTSGQAILLDGVISEICAEMEILEGQRHEWED